MKTEKIEIAVRFNKYDIALVGKCHVDFQIIIDGLCFHKYNLI